MNRLRTLIIGVVAVVVVACTSPAASAGPSGSTASSLAPASADASAAASGPAGAGSAACNDAFGPIADLGVSSISDLGDLDEVDATVAACESLADWVATAQQVTGADIREGAARMLLGIRCSEPSLTSAPICLEI